MNHKGWLQVGLEEVELMMEFEIITEEYRSIRNNILSRPPSGTETAKGNGTLAVEIKRLIEILERRIAIREKLGKTENAHKDTIGIQRLNRALRLYESHE